MAIADDCRDVPVAQLPTELAALTAWEGESIDVTAALTAPSTRFAIGGQPAWVTFVVFDSTGPGAGGTVTVSNRVLGVVSAVPGAFDSQFWTLSTDENSLEAGLPPASALTDVNTAEIRNSTSLDLPDGAPQPPSCED